MQPPYPPKSFEKLLFRSTLVPALLVLGLSAGVDYWLASKIEQNTRDAALLRTAYAVASRLSPDEEEESPQDLIKHLSIGPEKLLESLQDESIQFLVQDEAGHVLAGSPELLAFAGSTPPALGVQPRFNSVLFHQQAMRTVQFSHQVMAVTHHVLVGEMRTPVPVVMNPVFWNTLWPNLLLLGVMSFVLMHGTRQALQPLKQVCQDLDQRNPSDLRPILSHASPLEIETLIQAMNGLLTRLESATQEQQLFLSGAAHQLRTPLAGIQTQIELALEETVGAPQERLVRVLTAIEGLSHCSQQMLALARSSSQLQPNNLEDTFDIAEIAEELGSIWLDTALKARIGLVFELQSTWVQGSRWMIQEMLSNLLDNAIKYSLPDTEVCMRCYPQGNQACVEITDGAPLMEEKVQKLAISPFYRGNHPGVVGSGLGLTIVSVIVRQHQGRILFLPHQNGSGNCVSVLLPLHQPS